MSPRRTFLALILALVLFATVAGCGGGGGSSTRTTFSGAERAQATQTLKAYLAARVASNWPRACGYLAARVRHGLARIGENARKGGGKGCAGGAARLFSRAPDSTVPRGASVRVLGLRAEGSRSHALVIYRDDTGRRLALPLSREGGEWKVSAPTLGAPAG